MSGDGGSWRRPVGLVAVAAVAALTVGLVAAHHDPAAESSVAGIGADSDATTTVNASTTEAGSPAGSDQAGATGWSHDALGAVAVVVAVTRTQIGFDYDQAVTVAAAYADPDDKAAFEVRARTAVAARREQADVSARQEPPAPASYAATPLAYNAQQVGPDQYAVHLLSWITLTSTTAQVKDHLYVGTMFLTWSDTWRLTMPTPQQLQEFADQQPPAAMPGSDAFNRAGWILIDENNR